MGDAKARRRHLFFAIFTVSGFSGLIYESIWSHYLKLFLGHAAYAQTLVLAIFMGGMALGSWLLARSSHRVANLLIGYAIVEAAIGVLGLLFHRTSVGVTSWVFESVLPHLDHVAAAQAVKWSLGAALILPQSILLGMTFPLMSGACVRAFPERPGETLAMLYFTNSLGAALGVLISGFVLIGAVGLPGTMMTAGLLNILLALTVWGVVKAQPDIARPAPVAEPVSGTPEQTDLTRWILLGAAVTGAAAFLYEIAWLRMLSLVLGSSTHSFEMMLSAFILGIALGGLWVHRRIDAMADSVGFLVNILAVMAVVAILSLPVYNYTFDLMADVISAFASTEEGYIGISLSSHVIAMLVMVPTTFFCGMTLPVMTHVLMRRGAGERAIGAVYAWNTAGAIVGVMLGVHVLMPLLGVKGLVVSGATLQLLLGLLYRNRLATASGQARRFAVPAMVAVMALAFAVFFIQLDPAKLSAGVFRTGQASNAELSKVLLLEHGKTATVSLTDTNGVITISTNGKPDAAIAMRANETNAIDEITMVLLGALPLAFHDSPRRIATIGMGSGLTSHVLLASPQVESVDTIEIEPAMARAARIGFMPRVARTFTDPRSHIRFEDAKTFFAMNRGRYDLIVSEPSNPWVSGVATLFSQEFYQQMARHLEPNGMLVQWVQIYEVDMNVVVSIVKALAPVFSDFAVYSTDDANLVFIATRSGTVSRTASRAFDFPGVKEELARVGVTRPQDIEGRFLGDKKLLMPLLATNGVPANSDYFPYVDLRAARTRILKRNASEYTGVETLPVPIFELLDGAARPRAATAPSPAGASAIDLMGMDALAIRNAVLTSQYKNFPPTTARTLLALHSTSSQCLDSAVQRAWLASAYYVAAQTTTTLGVEDLKPLWEAIVAMPCAALLNPADRQMLTLLRAVAMRDGPLVATTGTSLFAAQYEFGDPMQRTYAVLATAASALQLDRRDIAIDVIRNHASGPVPGPSVAFALQWMGAIAVFTPDRSGERLVREAP